MTGPLNSASSSLELPRYVIAWIASLNALPDESFSDNLFCTLSTHPWPLCSFAFSPWSFRYPLYTLNPSARLPSLHDTYQSLVPAFTRISIISSAHLPSLRGPFQFPLHPPLTLLLVGLLSMTTYQPLVPAYTHNPGVSYDGNQYHISPRFAGTHHYWWEWCCH